MHNDDNNNFFPLFCSEFSIRNSSSVSAGERKALNNAKYSPSPSTVDNKNSLGVPGSAGGSENNKTPSPTSPARRPSQQNKNINITHLHGSSGTATANSAAGSPRGGAGGVSSGGGGGGGDDENRKPTGATTGSGASAACAKYLNHNGNHLNHHQNNLNHHNRDLLKPNNANVYGPHQQQQHRRTLNQSKPHKGDDAKKARKQVLTLNNNIIIIRSGRRITSKTN